MRKYNMNLESNLSGKEMGENHKVGSSRVTGWLRIFALALIPVQLMTCVPSVAWAVGAETSNSLEKGSYPIDRIHPAPELTPKHVHVNRELPKVEKPSSETHFSKQPTDMEISSARLFWEPLVAMGGDGKVDLNDNVALAKALKAFEHRKEGDDVSMLEQYLKEYPESRWRISLLTNLGLIYRRTGFCNKALESWDEAWEKGKGVTDVQGKALVDEAVAWLAELDVKIGRDKDAEKILKELDGMKRVMMGDASNRIQTAREGVLRLKDKSGAYSNCGPVALKEICEYQGLKWGLDEKMNGFQSGIKGTTLEELNRLASEMKMNYQMGKRKKGSEIPFPAIVHWSWGHYGALLEKKGNSYLVEDAVLGGRVWITQKALEDGSSGYFLVQRGELPKGWETVGIKEGRGVVGRGGSDDTNPDNTSPCDPATQSCGSHGSATYRVHLQECNLNINDTPLGYQPPLGPAVQFTVTYNHLEANQPKNPQFANLGPRCTCNWISYITDDPDKTKIGAGVALYYAGGGTTRHAGGDKGYTKGAKAGTGSYGLDRRTGAVMLQTGPEGYERLLSDGSKVVYGKSDGSNAFPRKIFMTKQIDPQGNTVEFIYDKDFRLVALKDAIGQVTKVEYLSNDPNPKVAEDKWKFYRIAKVTDPFGRSAKLEYDDKGRLNKITDVIGLSSELTYDGNTDFVKELKTVYGTSHFAQSNVDNIFAFHVLRSLELTDVMGNKERVEHLYSIPPNIIGYFEPASVVPKGMNVYNNSLNTANTFYWDKKAMAEGAGDYKKAHIFHWLRAGQGWIGGAGSLESEKGPLGNRVWYNYEGQDPQLPYRGRPDFPGEPMGPPTVTGVVLPDGTTQLVKAEYNDKGNITRSEDPNGRVIEYKYADDGIDLKEINSVKGGVKEKLAEYFYWGETLPELKWLGKHLVKEAIDASGKKTTYSYNDRGQVINVVDKNGKKTILEYESLDGKGYGYLTKVTGPAPENPIVKLAYDELGRVINVTDPTGYTVAMDYDKFDRVTKVTYPDKTTEEVYYNKLDAEWTKDRNDIWSRQVVNALRQPTLIQDGKGGVMSMEWCTCGALKKLRDEKGHETNWKYDLGKRLVLKTREDGRKEAYAYDNAVGRLIGMRDRKGQVQEYAYEHDGRLKSITYRNTDVPTPPVSFKYDDRYGRLVTMTDNTGDTNYEYYPMQELNGRLKKVSGSVGPAGKWEMEFLTYDESGRLKTYKRNGEDGVINYDSLGRVLDATNGLGTFEYHYVVGAPGLLDWVKLPNQAKMKFQYEDLKTKGWLKSIEHLGVPAMGMADGETISKFGYQHDSVGQITNWIQENKDGSQSYGFKYNNGNELVEAVLKDKVGANLKRFYYDYDEAVNLVSKQVDGDVMKSAFNGLNQLTEQNAGGMMRVAGSVTKMADVKVNDKKVKVSKAPERQFSALIGVTPGTNKFSVVAKDATGAAVTNKYQIVVNNGEKASFTYDPNGNCRTMVRGSKKTNYDWDGANRLVKITQNEPGNPVKETSMVYNGAGGCVQIIEKEDGVETSNKRFVWMGTERIEERDVTGAIVLKKFYSQGVDITGDQKYFYTRDHLGSIREMVQNDGAVAARYDYTPYGDRTLVSGTDLADFGYTGLYYHQPSGLNLAYFRAYNSGTCRWLNEDPIGIDGGVNLYAYNGKDSIGKKDPLGLDKKKK